MPDDSPYLSVVVVSRNDDHGGNPLQRTQLCINSLYEQCNRYRLPAELIVVDWNPPIDRPGLADVIRWPEDRRFIRTRVITVPPECHRSLPHSKDLPLFQMIGKNVGIRRARGEYVLATNIDILFSDELMDYISKRSLQHGHSYRVDRFDIRNDVLNEAGDAKPDYRKNVIRVNIKLGTFFNSWIGYAGKIINPLSDAAMPVFGNRTVYRITSFFVGILLSPFKRAFKRYSVWFHSVVSRFFPRSKVPSERRNSVLMLFGYLLYRLKLRGGSGLPFLHLNSCGDFTLLSRADWDSLGGYLEDPIFSWNLDSLLLIDAYYCGIREKDLISPKNVFHVEHGAGSGWTPGKGEQLLFERLEKSGIPYISEEDSLAYAERWREAPDKGALLRKIKQMDYGFLAWELPERCIE